MPIVYPSDQSFETFASETRSSWPAITTARRAAQVKQAQIDSVVADVTSEDVSVVAFGSLARREWTSGSDFDWMLLVDGQADPEHQAIREELDRRFRDEGIVPPGPEGTFGRLGFSHDLVQYIGGQDDTNRNITQRILLLLESAAFGDPDAHQRTVRNVLGRYVNEDFGWLHALYKRPVPRFLQNDIARYWRTVAVDFAYKRKTRTEGWALRTAKLRTSRKITYSAGLLTCFSCGLPGALASATDATDQPALKLVEHLLRYIGHTPVDIIASFALGSPPLTEPTKRLFAAFDSFLTILNDQDSRTELKKLDQELALESPLFQEVRGIGHQVHDALEEIFFDHSESGLPELTRTYGVF